MRLEKEIICDTINRFKEHFMKEVLFLYNKLIKIRELEIKAMRNKKILAVWGSPASGKTLTSVKLANMISQKKKDVVLVFCDPFVPVLPVILPYLEVGEKSLGSVLSSAEITQNKIFSNCLTLKKNRYLTLLGYRKGENVFAYPEYTKSNAVDILIQLRHIADYVIVDCTSHISADILSTVALEIADAVLRLGSCDLKGVSYFSSQLPCLFERRFNPDRHIKILSNFKDNQPKTEIKECYGGTSFELPYIAELEEQCNTGRLLEMLKSKEGKKYEDVLKTVAKEVFDE